MDTHEIYLAGGCFWGEQAFIERLPGIIETHVGYANSNIDHPTYEQVCSGKTNAAETVHVVYDADTISLEKLLEAYFLTINPTSINHQGNDIGTQYRTGIYWTDENDHQQVERSLKELQSKYTAPLAIEASTLSNYFDAEPFHQDYLIKHPLGYCHVNLADADKFVKSNF